MDTATNGASQTDCWVILEAMDHIRVAGRYYIENGLHRVDIPDPAEPERYRTEWYGNAAIFRITPVDELTARKVAAASVIPDAIPWDVSRQLRQLAAPNETIEAQRDDDNQNPGYWGYDDDDDREDDDDDDDLSEVDERPEPEDIPF